MAMLNIAVTAGGQILTKGLGLDHLHASIILAELEAIREQIEGYVKQARPSNVFPLRP